MDNKRDQQSLSRTYKIKGKGGQIVAFRGRGRRRGRGGDGRRSRKGRWKERGRERGRGRGRGRRGMSVGQPTLGGSTNLHLS